MKATLKIEAIGESSYQYIGFCKWLTNNVMPGLGDMVAGGIYRDYWVAKIIGLDPKYKYQREFLKPKKDYKSTNAKGSRGIYFWYLLESGNIYEVSSPISWKRTIRYFCKVNNNGDIIKIDNAEIDQWIKEHLA